MKTLTVTEVARNFSAVMDSVENEQEEIQAWQHPRPAQPVGFLTPILYLLPDIMVP